MRAAHIREAVREIRASSSFESDAVDQFRGGGQLRRTVSFEESGSGSSPPPRGLSASGGHNSGSGSNGGGPGSHGGAAVLHSPPSPSYSSSGRETPVVGLSQRSFSFGHASSAGNGGNGANGSLSNSLGGSGGGGAHHASVSSGYGGGGGGGLAHAYHGGGGGGGGGGVHSLSLQPPLMLAGSGGALSPVDAHGVLGGDNNLTTAYTRARSPSPTAFLVTGGPPPGLPHPTPLRPRLYHPSPPRLAWLDLMRCCSCMMVVLGTAAEPVARSRPPAGFSTPELYLIVAYVVLLRVGTNLFFMMSGKIFLPYQISPKMFFVRRLPKLIVPFVSWSLIYLVWGIVFRGDNYTFESFFLTVLHSHFAPHLWFLLKLFYLTLVTPIFSAALCYGETYTLLIGVVLWFLASPLQHSTRSTSPWLENIQVFRGSRVGYYLVGGLSKKVPRLSRRLVAACSAVSLLALAVMVVGAIAVEFGAPQPQPQPQQSPMSPMDESSAWLSGSGAPVVFVALPWFFVLRHFGSLSWLLDNRGLCRLFAHLAPLTYGIYLVHVLVNDVAQALLAEALAAAVGAVLAVPFVAGAVFAGSYGLVQLLRTVPLLREITS